MTTQQQTPKRPIPRKLNQGMIDALSLAIANGNYAITACQLCGVDDKTLWEWLKQAAVDEKQDLDETQSIYVALGNSLKKAESQAEAELVAVVREAGTVKRDWLPAMTFLERRHPDRWGRRERKDVNINETKTVSITKITIVQAEKEQAYIEGEARELPELTEGGEQ